MYPNGTSDYITKIILTVFASFFCKQIFKRDATKIWFMFIPSISILKTFET